MAKIQTVNQLISVFKDIATRHYQINGFGIGDDWENGASEEKMHPVLWINPVTASMPESESTGYKTFEIDFEVRVFDLVSKGESNENDVLSDCIDILKDIILEFKGHPYYVNSQLNIIDDISFEAFTEEFDENVSGWVCELSLMTPILNSFCGIPAADITGFEFPGIDCPDVNVLCPVFVEDVTGVYPIVVTTVGTTKEVSIVGGVGSDTYVISGVYDTGTLTLTRNDAVDVVVTGFASGGDNDYTTAATLSGNIITFDRTDTVGAYSVDLTSAINSAPDKFVSSGAFDDASKLLTLTLNDASDFDVDFSTLTTADKFVSSGAYDAINNKIVLTLNDATTVDIDTSAIGGGGGASIYTANDTIGAGRVATLTDTLRFKDGFFEVEGTGISGNTILSLYNGNTTPYKLWDFLDNGNVNLGVTFLSVGNSNTRTAGDNVVLLGNGLTVNDGKSVTIGSNSTTTSEYAVNIGYLNSVTGTGTAIGSGSIISGNASHSIGSDNVLSGVGSFGLGARISSSFSKTIGIGTFVQSSANGASAIGYGVNSGTKLTNSTANSLALGWNSATPRHVLGDSLVELGTPTTIKGVGTAGSSALTIYDNDTTPSKVFEVLDDSTIKTNGNTGFTGTGAYTNFTIENGIITNAT